MTVAAQPMLPRYHRWPAVLGAVAAVLVVTAVSCEVLGWPFLAGPMQRWLSSTLNRPVSLTIDGQMPASVALRLFGRLRIEAPQIDIAAPSWSHAPGMLHARDAVMSLHYGDLWRAHHGEPLRIHMLEAAEVHLQIERLADGRASWFFGGMPPVAQRDAHVLQLPLFDTLKADRGTLRVHDELMDLALNAQLRPLERGELSASAGEAPELPRADAALPAGLQFNAEGSWHGEPVQMSLQASGDLPWIQRGGSGGTMPVRIAAALGETRIRFDGAAADVLTLAALKGRFDTQGLSIATLAQPMGVVLPGRAAFRATGQFEKNARVWQIVLDRWQVGSSELSGQFRLDRSDPMPRLTGQLAGERLNWSDLFDGPPAARAATRSTLPALKGIAADIDVDIRRADSAPDGVQPLQGHWHLSEGQLEWRPSAATAPAR